MRARWFSASLTIIAWLLALGDAVSAQHRLTLGADVLFYGDNTEFRNPFREGETIFGAAARLDAGIELSEGVTLSLGVFGNQRFGSGAAFELVRPVIALSVAGRRSRVILGTLQTPRAGSPPGPDRTGPHGLVPALQRETLAFERPYEAGLQWTFTGARLEQESWLHWQRLNTADHRERLDAGGRALWVLRRPAAIALETHIVHEGGQLFASGPVRDSFALGSGLVLSNGPADLPRAQQATHGLRARLELLGLWSRYTADREAPRPARDGGAFFGRFAVERQDWRVHLVMWRGDDFIKDEGDPNYLSVRRDGSRYLGVRDYAETGVMRSIVLSREARFEVSVRVHRVEKHYAYSYRVLGVVHARAPVR